MDITDTQKLERVELVREKCQVSYGDAKAALELCDYDVLDAVVLLERQGKTQTATAHFSTEQKAAEGSSAPMAAAQADYEESARRQRTEEKVNHVFSWLKRLVVRSLEVTLVATRHGKQVVSVPLLLFVLLVAIGFWCLVPLMVVSLFFGFSYRFEGLGKVTVDVNDLSQRASAGAERIKQEVKEAAGDSGNSSGQKGE